MTRPSFVLPFVPLAAPENLLLNDNICIFFCAVADKQSPPGGESFSDLARSARNRRRNDRPTGGRPVKKNAQKRALANLDLRPVALRRGWFSFLHRQLSAVDHICVAPRALDFYVCGVLIAFMIVRLPTLLVAAFAAFSSSVAAAPVALVDLGEITLDPNTGLRWLSRYFQRQQILRRRNAKLAARRRLLWVPICNSPGSCPAVYTCRDRDAVGWKSTRPR